MKSKISLRWPALIVIGIAFFIIIIFFLIFFLPGHTYNYYIESTPKELGLPIRLEIPKIDVDAIVEHLGLTPQGIMDTPKGPADVAWFNLGPRPGNIGSAVIAGHYGTWKNGEGSVFDDLNKLIPGDRIYVKDEKGVTITFVVRELQTYGQDEYVPGVFSSSDEKAHLNLITCEGSWIEAQKTYSNRLVVFTDKEIE